MSGSAMLDTPSILRRKARVRFAALMHKSDARSCCSRPWHAGRRPLRGDQNKQNALALFIKNYFSSAHSIAGAGFITQNFAAGLFFLGRAARKADHDQPTET